MSATVYSRCIAKNSARGWWNIPDIFQFVPDSLIIILNLLDLQPQSFDVVLLGEIDVRQGVHPALKDKLDQLRNRIDVDALFISVKIISQLGPCCGFVRLKPQLCGINIQSLSSAACGKPVFSAAC